MDPECLQPCSDMQDFLLADCASTAPEVDCHTNTRLFHAHKNVLWRKEQSTLKAKKLLRIDSAIVNQQTDITWKMKRYCPRTTGPTSTLSSS